MATILFIVPRFHTNLWFATRALVEAGHDVEIAAATVADGEDHSFVAPTDIGTTPDAAVVAELMHRVSPELVIVRGDEDLLQNVARAGRRIGARVLSYNLRPMTRVTPVMRRIKNLWQGRPRRRITPVPGLDARARRDPTAFHVPFPVAALPHTATARDADGGPRILCVGKIAQRRKNQHLLIDALRPLASAGRPFRLTLIGSSDRAINGLDDDHSEALRAAARDEPWIDLHQDIPFERMADLYAAHDICVLPSVGEPLGAAPLEGMPYGTIPVVSTQAGAAGLIVDGETGLRVDVTRDGDLQEAMRRLLDDGELRGKLCAGARRFAETELSPARYVARIEALLPKGR
ncbi:glycosyltransferase family 4 protein [Jannaschia sp. S6380]|uniref:glycosyltransferase family 4 protein n=1 Tax=Jannaschia sp. S6380 TaxID=2926408 RepID=UPI001FF53F06|nr:glycosyltransferase family 4 protein [Jannaschia sp. S6380]MCK0167531.1 glycosyltransferase family 4 protein [Jannaschia sp. S6380]